MEENKSINENGTNKKGSSWSEWAIKLLVIVLLLWGVKGVSTWFMDGYMEDTPKQQNIEQPQEKYDDDELSIQSIVAIEKFLNFPDTAQYKYPINIERNIGGKIGVTSRVASQNAFGVPSTYIYGVWFKDTGSKLIVTDVYLDGVIMYKKEDTE